MGTLIVVLVVLAVVAFLVWQFVATKNALATTSVRSAHSPQEAAQIVKAAFGGVHAALWTSAGGPGTITMRRRGKDGGITMSVKIAPAADGGSETAMWTSQYNEYLIFFANFAGSVNSRKKAIARALAA